MLDGKNFDDDDNYNNGGSGGGGNDDVDDNSDGDIFRHRDTNNFFHECVKFDE